MVAISEINEVGLSAEAVTTIALIVIAVIYVALFCWLAVVGWAKHRRMEREAYYRHETEKNLIEKGEEGAKQILRLRNEEERIRWLRRREGFRVGGVVTAALGIGILVGLQMIETGGYSLAGAGGFPLIIGAALLLYGYVLYPKYTCIDIDSISPPSGEGQKDPHD